MFKLSTFIVSLLLLLHTGINPAAAHSKNNEYHFSVKSGDSLSRYFSKLGLSPRLLANLLSANKQNRQLNQLRIGEKITIRLDANRRFKSLSYQPHNKAKLNVILSHTKFNDKSKPLSTTVVTINRSFGYDAQRAGLSLSTINTIVNALSWYLDFNTDLHKGDRFFIVSDGAKRPAGIIYQSNRKRIEAFSYTNNKNRSLYYDRHGYTLNSTFLKAPLKYKRISSTFQLKRYHPILKTYRPHRAIDYAAARGTPVHSTADGVVQFKGWKGALGKAIMIKHGANYTTVYAHLSNYTRSLRTGKLVKKGQVIGYVGSTGRSTGPHLHYELRYKGVRKDPLSHKPSIQKKVNSAELWKFRSQVNKVLASLP